MNRNEIIKYIKKKYSIAPEYLWARTPNFAIFRHSHNRKWFAAIVDVTEDKLGLEGDSLVDALNLKCDPQLVGSLRKQQGILPAYHMNKEHWITVLLDGSVSKDEICTLINLSYDLTY